MKNINQKVKQGCNQVIQAEPDQLGSSFGINHYLDLLIKKLPKQAETLDVGCGAGQFIDVCLVNKGFKAYFFLLRASSWSVLASLEPHSTISPLPAL